LEIVPVTANSFEESGIAVKDDAGWKQDVHCYQKGGECTAVNLEITEKLGGMKHHPVSSESVR